MVRSPLTLVELQRGERLGALLRTARAERTMVDVAFDAGISPETLRKIESGRIATPAFATIATIAGVLNISLDELWMTLTVDADGLKAGRRRERAQERLAS
ncbi:helix-turn-helix domain-containing protein [Glutamicibacter bergerei]|uniref:Helix-turn-helix domain-containing protein n=1 Tax=Glutamicibacter bergerei TaxID=256702 RepID=A0ABV9MMZ8_9MICC|nr:transcriptional regulator [Micrococcaceae bacterium]